MQKKSTFIELRPFGRRDEQPLMYDDTNTDANLISVKKSGLQTLRKRVVFEDWKKTLYLGSILSTVVLAFNLGFVLWAVQHRTLMNGRGVIYSGDCSQSKKISVGFHLVINILGTVLLGASNYGMELNALTEINDAKQCLCAPSRENVDRAHSRGNWLDIGVQSMRNLWQIPRKHLFMWACLALSSLPLHLVYNSTIFQTISVYKFDVYYGNKPFSSFSADDVRPPYINTDAFYRLLQKGQNGELDRLENDECISEYAEMFQTSRGSVLLVTETFNSSMKDFDTFIQPDRSTSDPYNWICSGSRDLWAGMNCASEVHKVLSNSKNWTVTDTMTTKREPHKVKYCLSEKTSQQCTVEYSLPLAIVVIIVNVIKALVLCGATFAMTDAPVLTTGDAIASFLRKPDPITKGQSLLSRDLVLKPTGNPPKYSAQPRRWISAVSVRRWVICLTAYMISILVCIILLVVGFEKQLKSQNLWTVGLGEPNTSTMIRGDNYPASLVANTIIANIPQAVFSMLYFSSNGIYTIMSLAQEWSAFGIQRKGLRVSRVPRGHQRSTYFLSLPYRYSIPLLAMSALLHWIISQSLFLVVIKAYGSKLQWDPIQDQVTCGGVGISAIQVWNPRRWELQFGNICGVSSFM
ncbi:hypothetical protein FE257_003245 [Aspergillus nanangensis]|uniref:DUF6536 domain-containing protein n=1 Tax=Aspergillus nanangensis TaxID=2582783 RepID=A0AAD4GVI8_ASPNN|nr:hypothetical protein FE257_003245 [Aspergillus nanangensis]